MRFFLFFLLVALLVACCSRVSAQRADLVLVNANVITLRGAGDRATAVAMGGGTILAVGDRGAMGSYIGSGTKVIDLHGQTVVPGFNDVHQHPFAIYAWDKPYAVLELDTVTSMANLIALLRRKAADTQGHDHPRYGL